MQLSVSNEVRSLWDSVLNKEHKFIHAKLRPFQHFTEGFIIHSNRVGSDQYNGSQEKWVKVLVGAESMNLAHQVLGCIVVEDGRRTKTRRGKGPADPDVPEIGNGEGLESDQMAGARRNC